MKQCFLFLFSSLLLTSCYSYRVFPKELRNFSYDGARQTAYVTNPTLKREYAILQKSKIFILTSDSLDGSAIKIKLFPMKRNLVCGQPAIASLFTLGQIPVVLPDEYTYTFQELYRDDSQLRTFQLHLATRIWFWDMFAFNKHFDRKAGQIVCGRYYGSNGRAQATSVTTVRR